MPQFENTPDSKYQLRNRAELMHPGVCLSCRNGNCEDGYIDLGTYFDYEGQMYLCNTCVREIAEIIGMLTPEEAQFINNKAAEVADKLEATSKELEHANRRLRAIDDLIGPNLRLVAASNLGDSETDPDQPGLFANDASSTERAVSGESEPQEPVTSGSGLTGSARSERSHASAGTNPGGISI